MFAIERFIDDFRVAVMNQLREDLDASDPRFLMRLDTWQDGIGLWAAATIGRMGDSESWQFCRLILARKEYPQTNAYDDGEGAAVIFTTVLMEVVDTQPWPPTDAMSVPGSRPSWDLPGAVEAWPGGPHVRNLVPESLSARYAPYISDLHRATWPSLKDAIAKDPWIGPLPEFSEGASGVWLAMSMRMVRGGRERHWRYRELVIQEPGPVESADARGRLYVERAGADFQNHHPPTSWVEFS